jgi:hypothetical protein
MTSQKTTAFAKDIPESKMVHLLTYLINCCLHMVWPDVMSSMLFLIFPQLELDILPLFMFHQSPFLVRGGFDAPWVFDKGSGTHAHSQPC